MPTIVEQFDAVSIKNVSLQVENSDGTKEDGTKFGALGSIEGETTLLELIKNQEGVEVKKKVKPQKMDLTISAHIPVQVVRDIFGLTNEDLQPGVYAYATNSKGKQFTLTADVIDEFEDITKLIAFPNCVSSTGFAFSIENGASEVAEMEVTLTVYPDDQKILYYEAIISELDDASTIPEQWHTQFDHSLVELPAV